MNQVDWDDLRKKTWHFLLMVLATHAANSPRWAPLVPVIVAAAGISDAPTGHLPVRTVGAACAVSLLFYP